VVLPGALLLGRAARAAAGDPRPPDTHTTETTETLHGVAIADPYRWLEDQAAPETRTWIDAENAYTDAVIGGLPGKDRIERRLTELIKIDTVSVPFVRGGRTFYSKRAADQEQAILYLKKGGAPRLGVPSAGNPTHRPTGGAPSPFRVTAFTHLRG